jgi:hypothetical protein
MKLDFLDQMKVADLHVPAGLLQSCNCVIMKEILDPKTTATRNTGFRFAAQATVGWLWNLR